MIAPLASWNDGLAKGAILDFVAQVTTANSPTFVPPADRIATFDNDGTLWCEHSMYGQAFFVFDRIRTLAPQHPEWQAQEPFASVLRGDIKAALAGGEQALMALVMATHAGMTHDEWRSFRPGWPRPSTPKPSGGPSPRW